MADPIRTALNVVSVILIILAIVYAVSLMMKG
jgi:hypothetical protein